MNMNLGKKFLKYDIRKQILRKNKKLNHKAYTKSMWLFPKFKYLIGYHKKKTILAIVIGIIIYTYDLQKPIFRKLTQLSSPVNWLLSFFIDQKAIPSTITQQNYAGFDLSTQTINTLIKVYYHTDRQLFFGVGRYYLFNVYKQLGLIKTEQNERKFWSSSGFYKQRNQKASGVGLVQFIQIFEDGLQNIRETQPQTNEGQYLQRFLRTFIQKVPEIKKWQKQFNRDRLRQFIKNMPGDNMKKQQAIIDLFRDTTRQRNEPLTLQQLQKQIVNMGLRGLNYSDKFLYWQLMRVWKLMKTYSLYRKMKHPLTTELQKCKLQQQLQKATKTAQQAEKIVKELEQNHKAIYKQQVI